MYGFDAGLGLDRSLGELNDSCGIIGMAFRRLTYHRSWFMVVLGDHLKTGHL